MRAALVLSSVSTVAPGLYDVRVRKGTEERSFRFEVEGEDIPVLKRPPGFMAYVGRAADEATPLFEAILAFHAALAVVADPEPRVVVE